MFLQGIFALMPSVIFTYYLISYIHDARYGGLGFPLEFSLILAMGPSTGRIFGYILFGYIGDVLHRKKDSWFTQKGKAVVATITMILQCPIMIIAFSVTIPGFDSSLTLVENMFRPEYIIFGCLFFLGAFIGGGSGPNRYK